MTVETVNSYDPGRPNWSTFLRDPCLSGYRSERDREILLKMYGLLPGMEHLGTSWGIRGGDVEREFYTEYHMTNDRDLWTDPRTGNSGRCAKSWAAAGQPSPRSVP
jgi:hypothetical protein